MEENISNYSIQILTQVSYNLKNELDKLEALSVEIMMSDEMKTFDEGIRSKGETAKINALKKLESLFEAKVYGSEDIASIAFYPKDYDMVAKTDIIINASNRSKEGIFNRILETNGNHVWLYMKNKETDLGIETHLNMSGASTIRIETPVLFKKISSMNDTTVLGVIHIAPKKEMLQRICSNIEIGKEGKVILIDSSGKILSSMEDSSIGSGINAEIRERLKNSHQENGYFLLNLSNTQSLVCYSTLQKSGWKVISIIPFKNLMTRIRHTTVFIVFIIAVCIFVALLLSYMVTRSVCIPINRVNETVEYLGRGDFSKKLDVQYDDEISQFSTGFNKMIDDMQNLITEVYITKIQKLDSDFKALQAQINPHFLYNTLESINSLALIKKEMEISEMIRGLASVFRYSIKNQNAVVLLKDEMEHVRLYVLLQALRYEDRIEIEYDVPEYLLQAKVLKFILQPLVENAIIHGIEKTNRKGFIKVEANCNSQEVLIRVSDNGKGMPEEKLKAIQEKLTGTMEEKYISSHNHDSIGLINIHSRIKLHFGHQYGIHVDSEPDKWTVIKIILPLIE